MCGAIKLTANHLGRVASMATHNETEIMLHLGQDEVHSDGQVTSNSAQTLNHKWAPEGRGSEGGGGGTMCVSP